MRWRGRDESSNIEDVRDGSSGSGGGFVGGLGRGGGFRIPGGMGRGGPVRRASGGGFSTIIILVILFWC